MTNHMRFCDTWYPADTAQLTALLELRPETSRPDGAGSERVRDAGRGPEVPVLAVLPHAGLSYSARGQRAFWAPLRGRPDDGFPAGTQSILRDQIDAVVIVAPSHYVSLPTDTTVAAPFTRHETPFGDIPGLALAGDLSDRETVEREHAVELLLPALAHFLGRDVPVGAVVVGAVSGAVAARAAASRILDRLDGLGVHRPLWLVSSDATHYGSRFRWEPWGDGTWRDVGLQVYADDTALIEAGIGGQGEAYWQRLERPSTVCGRYALGLARAAVEIEEERGVLRRGPGEILEYYSSAGDVNGDGDGDAREFVCYATARIAGEWGETE